LPADSISVLGDFNNVEVTLNGVTSRFYIRDGKYYIFTEGEDGQYSEYEIKYTFGYHPLQQYLIEFENGYIQATRLAWDVLEQKWYHLNPDLTIAESEWLHWTNRSMNWNSMCSECHSTAPRKEFNDSADFYLTHWKEINTACESCHGPGSLHIENIENPSAAKDSLETYLSLTSKTTAKNQVDQCAPCHARRSTISDDYHPGDELYDHYIPEVLRQELYHDDGQIEDEVFVFGSFVQSKMYHNGVKCTDCHEPHSLNLKKEGNDLCLQCHEKKYDLPTHTFHKEQTEASECINCHMTGETYMVNDYRRDHSFRIPRPDQSVKYNTPNSCNKCHTDQDPIWAANAIEQWYGPERNRNYTDELLETLNGEAELEMIQNFILGEEHPAIARATAIQYLRGYRDPLILQAINQLLMDSNPIIQIESIEYFTDFSLEERQQYLMPLLTDTLRAVRVITAGLLAESPLSSIPEKYKNSFRSAIREYEVYLNYNADFKTGQLMLGQYYQKTGRPDKAEAAMLKSLVIDSLYNPTRLSLSLLYNSLGRNDDALRMYETVIQLEPNFAPAYYSAGLLLAEMNELERAGEYMKTAIEKDRSNPRVFFNYGIILQNLGNTKEAESVFKSGLINSPNNPDLHHAIAVLYLQNQKYREASIHINYLISVFPENPQYVRWKQQLDQELN